MQDAACKALLYAIAKRLLHMIQCKHVFATYMRRCLTCGASQEEVTGSGILKQYG